MDGEGDSIPVRENPSSNVTPVTEEPCTSQGKSRKGASRRGRRSSRMKDVALTRSAGQKLDIDFDDSLNPSGPNKSTYTSFVGSLVRSKASILTPLWKDVDKKNVKDVIWDSIRVTYNVPDSPQLKKKTLSYCAERWRKFKTNLANKYIFCEVPAGQDAPSPCDKYAFIDEQTWQEFVKMRTTPEALEKREAARETGRLNDCPQRYSRGGYEMAAQNLMAAKQKRLEEEAQSNPSVLENPPSPPKREDLWLHLRQKPNGDYSSEKTREVALKIAELKNKEAEGSFVSDGRNDILVAATGKPDHAGRVRGLGGRVGLKQYFGRSKRLKRDLITREEMEEVVQKAAEDAANKATKDAYEKATKDAYEKAKLELSQEFSQREAAMKTEISELKEICMKMMGSAAREQTTIPLVNLQQSTRGSCVGGEREGPQPCDLFVEDPHWRLVARGSVHPEIGSTVHHKQLEIGQVRVSVVEVIVADAALPLPTDQFKVVRDVVGAFISWPEKLVDRLPQAPPPRKSDNKPPKDELLEILDSVSLEGIKLNMREILGLPDMLPVVPDKVDVHSLLLPQEELTSAMIEICIKYLCDILDAHKKGFGFLSPNLSTFSDKERHDYVTRVLKDLGKNSVFLVPWHESRHWQLVVLFLDQNKVLFLCSMHHQPSLLLNTVIGEVVDSYHKSLKRKTKKASLKWVKPMCPRQPKGSNLCGHYVMRHMLQLVQNEKKILDDQQVDMFNTTAAFTDEIIDEMRNQLSAYLLSFLEK